MITVVTVNFHSNDFLELLTESIDRFSITDPRLRGIDNTIENRGHGEALNLAAAVVDTEYTMFVDVDTHFTLYGWDQMLLQAITEYDVIFGRGVTVKPVRPACMFMRTSVAKKYDWRATPGYKGHRVTPNGFDVGVQAYHNVVKDGLRFAFFETIPNRYGTNNGEEFCWQNKPFIYHHWHGTHLESRQADFREVDLLADKQKLFASIPWRLL
jgi:hypothetical protein